MPINVFSLGSGSKGNCIVISDGKTNIMVDAGLPINRIIRGLETIGLDIFSINGILLTHEHTDHIKSIPDLSSYTKVYSHEDTFTCIENYQNPKFTIKNRVNIDEFNSFDIGSFSIQAFNVSHDAAHPLGFNLYTGNEKISFLTDTGTITTSVYNTIKNSDVLVIESNHDIDLLKDGKYPYPLKKRILSSKGHLANVDCAKTVLDLAKEKTKKIMLAHLSENNNLTELAYWETENMLLNSGATKEDVLVKVATQNNIVTI